MFALFLLTACKCASFTAKTSDACTNAKSVVIGNGMRTFALAAVQLRSNALIAKVGIFAVRAFRLWGLARVHFLFVAKLTLFVSAKSV
ncbi:hypothetical protein [Dyella flagellata]|uniref:hypothetical protein n=1 Tax=Dyella flagellata TaxID=1867833 RepID=UPI0024E1532E|nr:hypothetical protein [Dyella flagellata]